MTDDQLRALDFGDLAGKLAKMERAYETLTDPELVSASKACLVALRALVVTIPPVIDSVIRIEAVIEKHQGVQA